MKIAEFLKAVSDEHGPLQTSAADLMERMSSEDFEELMNLLRAADKLIRACAKGDEAACIAALIEFPEIWE